MYQQVIDPLHSLPLSGLIAAAPLVLLLVLLGVVRMRSHWAGLIGLASALVVAVLVYGMPIGQAGSAALEGVAFGLFPIVWIIVNAVWINKLQQASGHFDVVGRTFAGVSADFRVQAILVAYCFGGLIESLSGFGTPVAITGIMLLALGFTPMKAACAALFANAAPAAFGSVGNPISALGTVTGIPAHDLGAMVGRQSPFVAALVPFALLLMIDSFRGLRQVWPAALTAGIGFGLGQFLVANYFAYQLTDLIAAVLSALCVVLLLRFWSPSQQLQVDGSAVQSADPTDFVSAPGLSGTHPRARLHAHDLNDGSGDHQPVVAVRETATRSAGAGDGSLRPESHHRDPFPEVVRAFSPYILLTVLFALVEIPGPVQRFTEAAGTKFAWPGLHVLDPSGKAVGSANFAFGWLGAPGTMLLLTGLLTMFILRIGPQRALRCYGRTLGQIKWATLTISSVLALGYLMNLSGMATTLGFLLAETGAAFALLSAPLGYFGVAVTGSDTGSNSLFGALQVAAGNKTGIDPTLLAAANSTGGVLGKVIAPQNLAIGASAVGLAGKEGELLRKVALWSLGFLVLLSLLILAQSTVLQWMTV